MSRLAPKLCLLKKIDSATVHSFIQPVHSICRDFAMKTERHFVIKSSTKLDIIQTGDVPMYFAFYALSS